MDNNDNDNDNDGSLGSDLALVTMGGGGVDDDMIAKQNKSLHRSAVDLTKEQDGARQLAKKYAAESREWEGRYQRVNKQLEDRERDLLEIKTDVEKCMQMKTFFEEKFRMADAVISQCVDEVSTTKRLHERHTEDSVKNWERVQKDHTERCARTEQQLTEVTRRLEITDGEKRVALESSESLSQECKELTAKLHATELKMHETVQKYEKELTELQEALRTASEAEVLKGRADADENNNNQAPGAGSLKRVRSALATPLSDNGRANGKMVSLAPQLFDATPNSGVPGANSGTPNPRERSMGTFEKNSTTNPESQTPNPKNAAGGGDASCGGASLAAFQGAHGAMASSSSSSSSKTRMDLGGTNNPSTEKLEQDVDTRLCKSRQWKVGSCFEDQLGVRLRHYKTYPQELFDHTGAVCLGRGIQNQKGGRAAETTCIGKATSLGISVNNHLSESSGTDTVGRTMVVYAVPLKAGVTREEYDKRMPELAAERLNSRAKKTTMYDRGTSAYALGTARQRDKEEHKASVAKGGKAKGYKHLTAEEKKQKILAEDPNFTPRNRNELNLKWKSIHGRTMNGNSVNELFELFNSKK